MVNQLIVHIPKYTAAAMAPPNQANPARNLARVRFLINAMIPDLLVTKSGFNLSKIAITRLCVSWDHNATEMHWQLGPDPVTGAYSTPADLVFSGKGNRSEETDSKEESGGKRQTG